MNNNKNNSKSTKVYKYTKFALYYCSRYLKVKTC